MEHKYIYKYNIIHKQQKQFNTMEYNFNRHQHHLLLWQLATGNWQLASWQLASSSTPRGRQSSMGNFGNVECFMPNAPSSMRWSFSCLSLWQSCWTGHLYSATATTEATTIFFSDFHDPLFHAPAASKSAAWATSSTATGATGCGSSFLVLSWWLNLYSRRIHIGQQQWFYGSVTLWLWSLRQQQQLEPQQVVILSWELNLYSTLTLIAKVISEYDLFSNILSWPSEPVVLLQTPTSESASHPKSGHATIPSNWVLNWAPSIYSNWQKFHSVIHLAMPSADSSGAISGIYQDSKLAACLGSGELPMPPPELLAIGYFS